jgi:hypothetical protein
MDQPLLSEIVLNVDEVLTDLKWLNIRKAIGSDEIPAKLIVGMRRSYLMINLSLSTGKFFTERCEHYYTTFQERKRTFFSNYRGISLLPILSSNYLYRCWRGVSRVG